MDYRRAYVKGDCYFFIVRMGVIEFFEFWATNSRPKFYFVYFIK